MVSLRKILMTTDLSVYSLAALPYMKALAFTGDRKLFLLYVAEITSIQGRGHHRTLDEARTALEEFAGREVSPELGMRMVVRTGSAAEEIKRFAEDEGADLVVMATHGRTGLRHMVLGSVAEKVVRISSVPVLTVKPAALRDSILKNEDVENELHLR